jgi:hypothetical protein
MEGPLDSCLSQRGHNALLISEPYALSTWLVLAIVLITHLLPFKKALRVMPNYFLQEDCHYFYRTALRGLNVSTSVSPLYA